MLYGDSTEPEGARFEALLKQLGSVDLTERADAVKALGKLGGAEATNALICQLSKETDFGVRAAVAHALGDVGGEKATEALIARYFDRSENSMVVRENVAFALGRIGGDPATEALITKLNSSETRVDQKAAASALGDIGGHQATEALIAKLQEADPPLLRHVVSALTAIGGDRVTDAIVERLEQSVPSSTDLVRSKAMQLASAGPLYVSKVSNVSAMSRFVETFATVAAVFIGLLAACAAVVIFQIVIGSSVATPAITIGASAVAGALGILAYAGWAAASKADASSEVKSTEREESAKAIFALSDDALQRLVIKSYREGQHALIESKASARIR